MATLTKKDRESFVSKALTDLWTPLRAELRELADAEALAAAKAAHPRFFELYADPANREYLRGSTSTYLSDFGLIKPGAITGVEN